jgi:HSP20 family molecular chaperone IbpA
MTTATRLSANTPKGSENLSTLDYQESRRLHDSLHNEIARRAFQLFEENGSVDGQDLEHWFQAETALCNRNLDISDSPDSVKLTAQIDGYKPDDLDILIGEHEAIVQTVPASQRHSTDRKDDGTPVSLESLVYVARWPWTVDPSSATASWKGNLLTVVAKKSHADGDGNAKADGEGSGRT